MHEIDRHNQALGLGELVLDASPDAVILVDANGRIVRLNPVAERLFGLDGRTSIGLELAETIVPPALRERHRLGFQRYLTTGESTIVGQRVDVVGQHSSGRTFPVELTIVPLTRQSDVSNTPVFAGFLRDISNRERAEAGLRFLAETGEILASSLDYEDTLRTVARLAVPEFADWCIVDLIDEHGQLYRLVAAHADPTLELLLRELIARFPPDPNRTHPALEALRTGQSILNGVVTEQTWRTIAADPDHLAMLRELRPLSGLTVPLIARGRTLGVIEFLRSTPGWHFDQDDLTLGEEVARRAATAVENARLHHATEAALRGAEETVAVLETVLGTAPIGFAFIDTSFRYVRINHFMAAINGATVQETIGRTVREVRPRLADQIESLLQQVLETGEPVLNLEISGVPGGLHGVHRHVLVSYYPIRTSEGEMLGVGSLITDITERLESEERVRFLAEASKLMAETLSYEETLASVARLAVPFLADWCLVYLLDESGAIRRIAVEHADPGSSSVRATMIRESQIDPEADAGVSRVIRTGESLLVLDPGVEELAADTEDPRQQQELITSFGVVAWICVPMIVRGETLGAISYMTAESGRRYSLADLALAEDIAQRAAVAVENARLFSQEQQSRATAEEAARSREQFLSIASHELKTPLTSIKAASQLLDRWLRRDNLDRDRVGRMNDQLRNEISRLELLVSDLLDATRIQQGRLDPRLESVDLAQVVRDLLPRFEVETGHATDHPIRLDLEDEVIGHWDPSRLDQVVTNLLSNAIKYSPAGSEVRISVCRDGSNAILTVSDDGIGLSKEDQHRLFQPFARADAVRQSIGGTGLGLFISRQIVEHHGGTIEVDSEPGAGSTFIVRLPLPSDEG